MGGVPWDPNRAHIQTRIDAFMNKYTCMYRYMCVYVLYKGNEQVSRQFVYLLGSFVKVNEEWEEEEAQ